MPLAQERMPTTSPQHPFVFALADLAASQTGTSIPIPGGVVNEYVLPKDGFVVGYGIFKSAANTGGSLGFDITINGTSTATISADTASTTEFYGTYEVPNEVFSAGDTLGVTYTTDASHAPTTQDVGVVVYVVFRDWNF